MKNTVLFMATMITFLSLSAHAAQPLVCTTGDNKFGGFHSISINEESDKTLVSGHASGGEAHFVAVFGPFEAEKDLNGELTTYTFKDQFNQVGHITVRTIMVKGVPQIIASSNYGMWSVGPMSCN